MNRNIYATILIILSIGLYFTVTRGILAEAGKVRESNNEYVNAIEKAKDLIAVRDKLLSDYKNLSLDDRTKLDKLVPNNIDNIRLIIDLNNAAFQRGLSLKGVKVTASAVDKKSSPAPNPAGIDNNSEVLIAAPKLEKVTVSFGVSTSYQEFITFLQDLESSLRIMDINHLTLTADDKGVYDWNIELQTYWLHSQ